jgi:transposase
VDAHTLEVVMEPSGTYGDAVRGYLSGLGLAVYRVSPKRVHDELWSKVVYGVAE